MASRLSALELKRKLDNGFSGLIWKAPEKGSNLLRLNFEKILASADPRELVQSLPPQVIYHAIKLEGLEASAGVLSLLSREQFVKIFDYDVWTEDQIDYAKAFMWLAQYRDTGGNAMPQRFRSLDEEYQIALLEGFLEAFDEEEIDRMPDEERNQLIMFPGGQIFYRVKKGVDPEAAAFVIELFESAIAYDMNYAASLLAYVTHSIPNESEQLLAQFRKARLEEDGFLSFGESMEVFEGVDLTSLRDTWFCENNATDQDSFDLLSSAAADLSYLEKIVILGLEAGKWSVEDGYELQQGSLYLANCLAASAKIEPDDIESLNRIFENAKAMMSLGLEYIVGGNSEKALECLKKEHPKTLFRAGLSIVYQYQSKVLAQLKTILDESTFKKLEKNLRSRKWGEAQWVLDTEMGDQLPFIAREILKGLFNRFPLAPIKMLGSSGEERIEFRPIIDQKSFFELQQALDEYLTSKH